VTQLLSMHADQVLGNKKKAETEEKEPEHKENLVK